MKKIIIALVIALAVVAGWGVNSQKNDDKIESRTAGILPIEFSVTKLAGILPIEFSRLELAGILPIEFGSTRL